MAHTISHRASLVAVELGASWPAALIAAEAGICRVIAEVEGEGPLAFAERVDTFARDAFPRGTQVTVAVIACNQRADQTAGAARRAMAECLLANLAPNGTLWFAAADEASDRFRRRLFDLVAELGKDAPEGRVRAIFGEDSPRTASGPVSSQGTTLPNRTVSRVA